MVTDTPALRKARGAFFTPQVLAEYISSWALRSQLDRVLEPSCGDAEFLEAAGQRLVHLGLRRAKTADRLHGVEIHPNSARVAADRLAAAGFASTIDVGDFFDYAPRPFYDVVIGNPPYVRYQQFSGEARAKGLKAALSQGVPLTGLSSSWAAFTVHAAQFLRPEGRLGLVLPAELLSVKYAAEVRRFLLKRFAKVRLVLFEELVFPGVLEEVVLLLAEGSGGAKCFELYQARNLEDLPPIESIAWKAFSPTAEEKWTPALLPDEALSVYQKLLSERSFSRLIDWGETYLGAVTGNNEFFSLTAARVQELQLEPTDFIKISPPGSRHFRGLTLSKAAWSQLAGEEKRCFLFRPSEPSKAARRYIEIGEAAGVAKAYKCRKRSPWWRTPLVEKPDLFFTYMNQDRPRLVTNDAGVQILNSVYGTLLRSELRVLGRSLLPLACLNSLTLLGAEIVGRAYGGGLLKHEPSEADQLPVPSVETLTALEGQLEAIKPQVGAALRSTQPLRAVELVDKVVFGQNHEISSEHLQSLRAARDVLMSRRNTRSRAQRETDRSTHNSSLKVSAS